MLIQKITIQASESFSDGDIGSGTELYIQDNGKFILLSKDNLNCFEVFTSYIDELIFKICHYDKNYNKFEKIETIQNYEYKPNLKIDFIYSQSREEFFIDVAE